MPRRTRSASRRARSRILGSPGRGSASGPERTGSGGTRAESLDIKRQNNRARSRPELRDPESVQVLGLFLEPLDALDAGTTGTLLAEGDQSRDALRGPFEDRLDTAIGSIPNPSVEPLLLCPSADAVAKEDALDVAVDDDALPLGRRSVH